MNIEIGDRIYHRRADLFGAVEAFVPPTQETALVRYEWPHDGKNLVEVKTSELVPASEAPTSP